MAIVIALVLGLLALAFVLQPLYKSTSNPKHASSPMVGRGASKPHPGDDKGKPPPFPSDSPSFASDSITIAADPSGQTEREQAARVALHEVELDYQLGNITEADYRLLRERYMRRALRELKSRYDREQELDEVIEEQLRRMKEEHEQIF